MPYVSRKTRRTTKSKFKRYRRKARFTKRPFKKNPVSKLMQLRAKYYKTFSARPRLPASDQDEKMLCRLKYHDTITLTQATTTSAEHLFAVNSIYDPNVTGTGHQPYLHDQLSSVWSRYNVKAVDVKVTYHANAAQDGYFCYITMDDVASVSTTKTADVLKENRGYIVGKDLRGMATYVGVRTETSLRCFMPMSKLKQKVGEGGEYIATFGSNPTDLIYMKVGFCGNSVGTGQVYAHVDITYFVECRGGVEQAQS